MTIKAKRIWLTIAWVFMLVDGIILCCTLFGLPLGIPAIIGSMKFKELKLIKNDVDLAEKIEEKRYRGWSIFSWFVAGVVGVLTFIFVYCLDTKKD